MSARTEPAARNLEMSSPSAFSRRHLGPTEDEAADMARSLGCGSVDELISKVVPEGIRLSRPLRLPEALTEEGALQKLQDTMRGNQVVRSFIGLGYHDTFTPPVIQRNILENPG
jgi:glycine dehydrogenase